MQNWGCSGLCHFSGPSVLPLPNIWFLSSFDNAIISLWQSLSWHFRNGQDASSPYHTNLGHACHKWLWHCSSLLEYRKENNIVTISNKGFLLNSCSWCGWCALGWCTGDDWVHGGCIQWVRSNNEWVPSVAVGAKDSQIHGCPKLCSLPPSTEDFVVNMKRAHF